MHGCVLHMCSHQLWLLTVVEDREISSCLESTAGCEDICVHIKISEVVESNALTCEDGEK